MATASPRFVCSCIPNPAFRIPNPAFRIPNPELFQINAERHRNARRACNSCALAQFMAEPIHDR